MRSKIIADASSDVDLFQNMKSLMIAVYSCCLMANGMDFFI